ncbi:unnamed protein product, partial [Ilex paraguariensis]
VARSLESSSRSVGKSPHLRVEGLPAKLEMCKSSLIEDSGLTVETIASVIPEFDIDAVL